MMHNHMAQEQSGCQDLDPSKKTGSFKGASNAKNVIVKFHFCSVF